MNPEKQKSMYDAVHRLLAEIKEGTLKSVHILGVKDDGRLHCEFVTDGADASVCAVMLTHAAMEILQGKVNKKN